MMVVMRGLWGVAERDNKNAPHTSIPECCINIDRCRSNPQLSSIKGLKCHRTGPVHQMRLSTLFPGDVLFSVKSHAQHHGIS